MDDRQMVPNAVLSFLTFAVLKEKETGL